MKKLMNSLAATTLIALSQSANAVPITGAGLTTDSAFLSTSTVVDFESVGTVNVPSLSVGGVTFTGNTDIEVDSDFAGNFNTRGLYHITNHGNDPTSFLFDFDTTVDAFAFMWGAADVVWNLSVYNGVALLETLAINPTYGSNAGDYFGIASAGITHATLVKSSGSGSDYVFIDNFTYSTSSTSTSVPEPASLALLGLGLAGLGFSQRKSKAQ